MRGDLFGVVVKSLSEGSVGMEGGDLARPCFWQRRGMNRPGLKESSAEGKGMLRMPLGSC